MQDACDWAGYIQSSDKMTTLDLLRLVCTDLDKLLTTVIVLVLAEISTFILIYIIMKLNYFLYSGRCKILVIFLHTFILKQMHNLFFEVIFSFITKMICLKKFLRNFTGDKFLSKILTQETGR